MYSNTYEYEYILPRPGHISIYILEKGIVKCEPLERQEVYDTML